MRRRDLVRLMAVATAWPFAVRAQQITRKLPMIGFTSIGTDPWYEIQKGLAQADLIRDRDFTAEFVSDINELVRRQPAVIIALTLPQALSAKAATASIPIVFQTAGDPVAAGLVESWNRPVGNLTGITNLTSELIAKRLEILLDLVPSASLIAYFGDALAPAVLNEEKRLIEGAANKAGKRVLLLDIAHSVDIKDTFDAAVRARADGLVVSGGALFYIDSGHIASLAIANKMPTVFSARNSAVAGGLASFGSRLEHGWQMVGNYAGRILKGEKPTNLPVQQSTRTELVLNLKTAKALGLTVPLSLQARADEVIE